jgi:hypothetical protein
MAHLFVILSLGSISIPSPFFHPLGQAALFYTKNYILIRQCLDFIVVADRARKAIRSAIGNGNGESFLGRNSLKSICVVACDETIIRDCNIPVGFAPFIPFWIAKALRLKIVSLIL